MLPKNHLPPLLPRPPNTQPPNQTLPPKRSRVLAACVNCRSQKKKCNGQRPSCHQCQTSEMECKYELPEGMTKSQASKRRASDMEKSNHSLYSVVGLLRHGSEVDSTLALKRIREAENIDEAITTLTVAQAMIDSAPRHPNPGPNTFPNSPKRRITSPSHHPGHIFEKQFTYARDVHVEDDIFINMPVAQLDFSRWTTACDDNQLMNHLMSLFWTWENSVERYIYRPLFEEDLISIVDPNGVNSNVRAFCTPFLVNALLALSCLYTTEPTTYSNVEDPSSRGRLFADAADLALEKERGTPSVPLFQGLFAMFCYEGNFGQGVKSVEYFSQAVNAYNAFNHAEKLQTPAGVADRARLQRERHALSWSMWGFYVTEWRASQPLGFRKLCPKPLIVKTWLEDDFPFSKPESSGFWWAPYPMSLQTQRSLKIEGREVDVRLAEIAEETLEFVTPDENSRPPTENPSRALELYDAVIRWKYSLPDRIRFEEALLPSAILVHVHAELLLTAILRPFSQMSKNEFGRFNPRERCCSHASKMMTAIWTYRAFAILKTEYWLMHAISTSTFIVMHDLEFGSAEVDTLIRACQCLNEMSKSLPLASDCLSTINAAFKRSRSELPDYVSKFFKDIRHRKDGLMHHAVAALMPTADSGNLSKNLDNSWSPMYQELLDQLEEVVLD